MDIFVSFVSSSVPVLIISDYQLAYFIMTAYLELFHECFPQDQDKPLGCNWERRKETDWRKLNYTVHPQSLGFQ